MVSLANKCSWRTGAFFLVEVTKDLTPYQETTHSNIRSCLLRSRDVCGDWLQASSRCRFSL
jgi:hypothetical protein